MIEHNKAHSNKKTASISFSNISIAEYSLKSGSLGLG